MNDLNLTLSLMNNLYFKQVIFKYLLSKTYKVRKQRFEVFSVFYCYYVTDSKKDHLKNDLT